MAKAKINSDRLVGLAKDSKAKMDEARAYNAAPAAELEAMEAELEEAPVREPMALKRRHGYRVPVEKSDYRMSVLFAPSLIELIDEVKGEDASRADLINEAIISYLEQKDVIFKQPKNYLNS